MYLKEIVRLCPVYFNFVIMRVYRYGVSKSPCPRRETHYLGPTSHTVTCALCAKKYRSDVSEDYFRFHLFNTFRKVFFLFFSTENNEICWPVRNMRVGALYCNQRKQRRDRSYGVCGRHATDLLTILMSYDADDN